MVNKLLMLAMQKTGGISGNIYLWLIIIVFIILDSFGSSSYRKLEDFIPTAIV